MSPERALSVLLIQPSARNCIQTLFSIYNTDEGIGFKPPIGLLSIASHVHATSPHRVEILDCQLDGVEAETIHLHVTKPYDVIGISAWTDFWFEASSIARRLKEINPASHVCLGGPHVNIFPRESLSMPGIDSVILGDGEIPFANLLNALAKGEDAPPPLASVYFRDKDYQQFHPYFCADLDSLPIPDRALLPIQRYGSVLSQNDSTTSMITSRGCPFACVFCKLRFQKPVCRSAESIIQEFEEIARLGIQEVEVYDDTFNWSHERTRRICLGLIEKGIRVKWAIRDRVDRVSEEILILLKKAGCYRIHLGIESGSQRLLQEIGKRITIEQARRAVNLAKKHGFTVLTYFMYGLPTETLADARKTLRFALELDSDYAEFSIMIPYPGTEAYTWALRERVIPRDFWQAFALHPTASYQLPHVVENLLSREDLMRLRNLSIRKFYFNPRYIFRELLKVRSIREVMRKADMALGLLKLLIGKFVR